MGVLLLCILFLRASLLNPQGHWSVYPRTLSALRSPMSGPPLFSSLRRAGTSTTHKAGSVITAAMSKSKAAASSSWAMLRDFGLSVMVGCPAMTDGMSAGARRQVAWWLGGTTLLVYGLVVLGGITRVTRCCLSLTECRLSGITPPSSEDGWQALYHSLRGSPEFEKAAAKVSLSDFKSIVKLEYALKIGSWLAGAVFLLPGAYFFGRGYVNDALAKRLGLLLLMGGTHVLAGSFVWSGGLKKPSHDWDTPHVRPYRPGAHLISAFSIYAVLLWTALDVAFPKPLIATATAAVQQASQHVRSRVLLYAGVVAFTGMTGAFVAGKDAGRAYNTYPSMDGKFFPDEYWDTSLRPIIRNTFENTAANQFHHRMMALTTALGGLLLWPWAQKFPIPVPAKRAIDAVLGVTILQGALGVWTLVSKVPVNLGTLHQANSLNLLTAVLVALHMLRPVQPGPMSSTIARIGSQLAASIVVAVGLGVSTQP